MYLLVQLQLPLEGSRVAYISLQSLLVLADQMSYCKGKTRRKTSRLTMKLQSICETREKSGFHQPILLGLPTEKS